MGVFCTSASPREADPTRTGEKGTAAWQGTDAEPPEVGAPGFVYRATFLRAVKAVRTGGLAHRSACLLVCLCARLPVLLAMPVSLVLLSSGDRWLLASRCCSTKVVFFCCLAHAMYVAFFSPFLEKKIQEPDSSRPFLLVRPVLAFRLCRSHLRIRHSIADADLDLPQGPPLHVPALLDARRCLPCPPHGAAPHAQLRTHTRIERHSAIDFDEPEDRGKGRN